MNIIKHTRIIIVIYREHVINCSHNDNYYCLKLTIIIELDGLFLKSYLPLIIRVEIIFIQII